MIPRYDASIGVCGVCLGVLLLGLGCNQSQSNVASIAGDVQLDGQPVESGSIRLLPLAGTGSIASGQIVNGRYQISGKAGPAIGWNRVEINGSRRTGKTIQKPFPQHGTMEETVEAVAPQFNSKSILKCEVTPGENTANFDVTSK